MNSVKHQTTFVFTFQPLVFLKEPDRSVLQNHLQMLNSPAFFSLEALQRKHLWAFAVPLGVFSNDYSNATFESDLDARDKLFASTRARWFRSRDIIERDGVVYYQRNVLTRARNLVSNDAQRAMFQALLGCMSAAEADPTIVKGPPERKPGLSPDQRRQIFGHNRARGASWTTEEDAVLYRWFGMRTVGIDAGRHTRLTPEMWDTVLSELGGTRSRQSIRQRLNALNHKLLVELLDRQQAFYGTRRSEGLRKGFVPEYMRRVLGEKPRLPPTRERARIAHGDPSPANP